MDFIRHHVKETESKIPTSFKSCNSSIQLPSSKFRVSSATPVDRRQTEGNFNGTHVFNPSPILGDDEHRHYHHQKNRTSLPQQKQSGERDDLEEPKPESDPYPDPLPVPSANVTGQQIITKTKPTFSGVRHRECLKNHAASTGGQVFDGCGEFMPSGEEGTLGALKCAACHCHRNFHRKEVEEEEPYHDSVRNSYIKINRRSSSLAPKLSLLELSPLPLQYQKLSPGLLPIGRPSPLPFRHTMMGFNGGGATDQSSSDHDINLGNSNSAEASGAKPPPSFPPSKKRFRTKFTQEQKEKMLEFAEKIGWRLQKPDEPAVQMLCSDLGIKREVLKVWIHNNKNSSSSMKSQQFNEMRDEP